jgi:cytochrome c-type biogenesis protein CcmH
MVALAAMSQTASEKPSQDVRRVGAHLQCLCGCKDSVSTCSMLECSHSKPAKEKIARMQQVGMTDDQIIQSFIREDGPGIYLAPPSAFGWVIPYAAVGVGLLIIWAFLKKYRRPRPLAEIPAMELDDPALAKYKDQIEKELADLD